MILLPDTLAAWRTPGFETQLKTDIEHMTVHQLPLQQGLTNSSYALDHSLQAVIIKSAEAEDCLQIKAGIFYTGVIAGCNCADDPTPADELPEYCLVELNINKVTAETIIRLIDE